MEERPTWSSQKADGLRAAQPKRAAISYALICIYLRSYFDKLLDARGDAFVNERSVFIPIDFINVHGGIHQMKSGFQMMKYRRVLLVLWLQENRNMFENNGTTKQVLCISDWSLNVLSKIRNSDLLFDLDK